PSGTVEPQLVPNDAAPQLPADVILVVEGVARGDADVPQLLIEVVGLKIAHRASKEPAAVELIPARLHDGRDLDPLGRSVRIHAGGLDAHLVEGLIVPK